MSAPIVAPSSVSESVYAAALSCLPAMGLRRLSALLGQYAPSAAYAVAAGQVAAHGVAAKILSDAQLAERWREAATDAHVDRVMARCASSGIQVVHVGSADYPAVLAGHDAPPVLFLRGDPGLLADGRRVAIVGTRNATSAGRHAAQVIAGGLAECGVHVVSGLARGIDGWAHRSVVESLRDGRPIGVVASGLDVVYPREHRELWAQIADAGLLVSEAAPGVAPEAYRFPLRNRIIAALAEVVVVVESRERGGSLITAQLAADRGVPLMAVPGSLHNPAAAGTNRLLREGAGTVLDATDVLIALSIDHRRSVPTLSDTRSRPRKDDLAAYRACCEDPRTIDGLVLAVGTSVAEVAMSLARLEQGGWVAQTDGWYQPIGAPLR